MAEASACEMQGPALSINTPFHLSTRVTAVRKDRDGLCQQKMTRENPSSDEGLLNAQKPFIRAALAQDSWESE
jgi:hypothetical protein